LKRAAKVGLAAGVAHMAHRAHLIGLREENYNPSATKIPFNYIKGAAKSITTYPRFLLYKAVLNPIRDFNTKKTGQ